MAAICLRFVTVANKVVSKMVSMCSVWADCRCLLCPFVQVVQVVQVALPIGSMMLAQTQAKRWVWAWWVLVC